MLRSVALKKPAKRTKAALRPAGENVAVVPIDSLKAYKDSDVAASTAQALSAICEHYLEE